MRWRDGAETQARLSICLAPCVINRDPISWLAQFYEKINKISSLKRKGLFSHSRLQNMASPDFVKTAFMIQSELKLIINSLSTISKTTIEQEGHVS